MQRRDKEERVVMGFPRGRVGIRKRDKVWYIPLPLGSWGDAVEMLVGRGWGWWGASQKLQKKWTLASAASLCTRNSFLYRTEEASLASFKPRSHHLSSLYSFGQRKIRHRYTCRTPEKKKKHVAHQSRSCWPREGQDQEPLSHS